MQLPDASRTTALLQKLQQLRDQVVAAPSAASASVLGTSLASASVLGAANAIAVELDAGMSAASLFQNVHPDEAVRTSAEQAEQALARFATELSLDRPYFDAIAAVPTTDLDAETKRFIAHTLRDFRRSGVDRDAATRAEIQKLSDELVAIGQEFGKNIREDVRQVLLDSPEELAGLPDDYVRAHPKDSATGKIRITTDYPDAVPFMTYAESDAARRALYEASRQRGQPKNQDVLEKMIRTRHRLACLLGYASWADYVTETRMIKNAAAAQAFVDRIDELARTQATRDYAALLARKQQDMPLAREVGEWERAFYEEKVRRERFNFSAQDVRPYFPYEAVKEGVLAVCARLFGVRFVPVDGLELWHDEVEAFDVVRDGQAIGRFMLDMHPRPGKYKHAAQFTLQSGLSQEHLPIGVLVCNFPRHDELLEHKDVVTFFHEFGHLLHHIFGGRQRWLRFSGVATEWDFVEAPSQLLEEWAWNDEVLASFARHVDKGEPIPKDLVRRMRDADEFGKGLQARVQMFYAAVSLSFFREPPETLGDLTERLAALQARYSPFAYVPGTAFHLSFGHLEGYSAGYYTYMWSLVIAKDLLSRFRQDGLMDERTAHDYRDQVLAPGGSADAAELIARFLGRPYSFEAYERWLNGRPAS